HMKSPLPSRERARERGQERATGYALQPPPPPPSPQGRGEKWRGPALLGDAPGRWMAAPPPPLPGSPLPLLAGNSAVADVLAVETAAPADLLCQAVSRLLCLGNAGADGGGAEHTAAGGDHLACGIQRGAGVEDLAVELRRLVQAVDHVALGVVARIAAGGQYHAHGRARIPGRLDLAQRLRQRGLDQQH